MAQPSTIAAISQSQSQSQCRLSTRISIRWLPEAAAFENTDTTVMSVKDWYVDLRIDKVSGLIDWAIAGRRIVETGEKDDGNDDDGEHRVTFTHELDSHNTFDAVDCGSFTILPNGDELETGSMPRTDLPGTAPVMTEYEEVWRELQFREGPEGPQRGVSWIVESEEEDDEEKEEVQTTKTFIARIWGTYMVLQQPQTYTYTHTRTGISQIPHGKSSNVIKKTARGEVSARLEEWDSSLGCWKAKYILGTKGNDLPSMMSSGGGGSLIPDIKEGKEGSKLTIAGATYVVRAFEELL